MYFQSQHNVGYVAKRVGNPIGKNCPYFEPSDGSMTSKITLNPGKGYRPAACGFFTILIFGLRFTVNAVCGIQKRRGFGFWPILYHVRYTAFAQF